MPRQAGLSWNQSIGVLAALYVAALAAGGAAAAFTPGSVWVRLLVADLVATAVVFAGSLLLDNTSAYDPYWSVAPLPIALWAWWHPDVGSAEPVRMGLVALALAIWGARLTWNFARGWPGLQHEDWRYDSFRRFGTVGYWGISLAGCHVMPTLWVFGGLLPVIAMTRETGRPPNLLDGVAMGVVAGAILMETVADEQLRAFRASNPEPDAILQTGVWAASRHPNYFGELSFWWGIWLFGIAADPGHAWTIVGPLALTALFVFVSVPLIDTRMLERRPHYAEVQRRIPALLPLGGLWANK